jgi:hypothetical protein
MFGFKLLILLFVIAFFGSSCYKMDINFSKSKTVNSAPPVLSSAGIKNSSPSFTSNFYFDFGDVTGTFTDYCVLANDIEVDNCQWVTSSTLPTRYAVWDGDLEGTQEDHTGAIILSVWLKNSDGISDRVDTNTVIFNDPLVSPVPQNAITFSLKSVVSPGQVMGGDMTLSLKATSQFTVEIDFGEDAAGSRSGVYTSDANGNLTLPVQTYSWGISPGLAEIEADPDLFAALLTGDIIDESNATVTIVTPADFYYMGIETANWTKWDPRVTSHQTIYLGGVQGLGAQVVTDTFYDQFTVLKAVDTTPVVAVNNGAMFFTNSIPGSEITTLITSGFIYEDSNALSISSAAAIETYIARDTGITSIPNQLNYGVLSYIDVSGNNLASGTLDSLVNSVFSGSVNNGVLDMSNQDTPYVPSFEAETKITNLIQRGWTVTPP